ncbi:MAG: hypothetical protein LAT56_00345 [Wenzhouxiangella sp.]|nr:hypothetical protein [Wenzhouxiangella sp.]
MNEFLITFVGRTDVAYIAYALGVEMLGQALLWAGLAVAFAVSRRFFIAGFFYGMLDMHTKGTPMHLYFYRFYVTDSMNSGWHVFGYMLVIAAVVTPIVFYVIELTERKTA